MTMDARTTHSSQRASRADRASGVGARVRELRQQRGLTQGELAGERFSKEYVSQVELGKTRPSSAALHWFAERLGVDPLELAGESVAVVRAACEAAVARAEAEIEATRYAEASACLTPSSSASASSRRPR